MAIGFHGHHSERNSLLNTKLLVGSIYVHVLVKFVVTFSMSSTYQYCCRMSDCR